jgi:hypothetical protein
VYIHRPALDDVAEGVRAIMVSIFNAVTGTVVEGCDIRVEEEEGIEVVPAIIDPATQEHCAMLSCVSNINFHRSAA